MITKRYKNTTFKSIEQLLRLYPKREFKSPYRSTIPLIILSENNNYFTKFVDDTESNTEMIYEFGTPVRKGSGFPSCTDLMIKTDRNCLAIEAKRKESKYKTVSE